jgi:hypothetical protein
MLTSVDVAFSGNEKKIVAMKLMVCPKDCFVYRFLFLSVLELHIFLLCFSLLGNRQPARDGCFPHYIAAYCPRCT